MTVLRRPAVHLGPFQRESVQGREREELVASQSEIGAVGPMDGPAGDIGLSDKRAVLFPRLLTGCHPEAQCVTDSRWTSRRLFMPVYCRLSFACSQFVHLYAYSGS